MPRLGDILKRKTNEQTEPIETQTEQKNNAPERVEDSGEIFFSLRDYIAFPSEIQDWMQVYYRLGFVPMICYQTKNPAYPSWVGFKEKRPSLEYLLTQTTYHQDPAKATLGIVQTYDNVRFMIIDIDDMSEALKLHIDTEKKTLIENTNRGIHILVKVENYDPLLLGDKRKVGAVDLLFVHNTIVAPSQINGVKRGWRYLTISEAVHCKLSETWPRPLSASEFAAYIENDELLTIDLKDFELTKRFFESSRRSSEPQSEKLTDRAHLIQKIQTRLVELNERYRFYQPGIRHEFALRIAAMARKCPAQFTFEETLEILKPFIEHDDEAKDRRTAIFDTYKAEIDEINYSDLLTALYGKFEPTEALHIYREIRNEFFGSQKQETTKSGSKTKLQRFFESFLSFYAHTMFKTKSLLYLWNGKYIETVTPSDFATLFLNHIQNNLGELATDYYANQVYKNLLACDQIAELPDWKDVIAFENYVFDLSTLLFKPHSIEDGNRFIVRANALPAIFYTALTESSWINRYRYVVSHTTHFRRFIETLEFDDLALQQLIEMLGYAMLPRLRKYNHEVCFVMFGEGANGKSTVTHLIQRLFRGFFSSVSLSDLEGFSLSSLLNSYLNIANEITEKHDKTIAVENFKRTVSWDVMEIPIKFQPHVQAALPLVHIFAVNQKPRVNEFTYAVYRRFNFIHFAKTIPENERDRDMLSKLWAERDYIVTAALLGALKIADEGKLENNKELLNLTMLANNPLIGFLLDNYIPAEPSSLKGSIDDYVQKATTMRDLFHKLDGSYRFKNIEGFKQALKQAIHFIAENIDPAWRSVRFYADTRHSKEFKNQRYIDVVYPLRAVSK